MFIIAVFSRVVAEVLENIVSMLHLSQLLLTRFEVNLFGSTVLEIVNLKKLIPWDLYDFVKVHSKVAFISKVSHVNDSAIVSDEAILITPFFRFYFVSCLFHR